MTGCLEAAEREQGKGVAWPCLETLELGRCTQPDGVLGEQRLCLHRKKEKLWVWERTLSRAQRYVCHCGDRPGPSCVMTVIISDDESGESCRLR